MNENETLDYLLKTKYSLARFGDGEFAYLTRNWGVPTMQKFDPILKSKLLDVIHNPIDNLLVTFHKNDVYSKIIDISDIYGASFVTRPINVGIENDEYFDRFRMLWNNEDIVLINFSPDLQKNYMFQNAKSITFIKIPRRHCFDCYDELWKTCQIHFGKTFLLSCGIMATSLSYDLTKKNQRALDIGKIAFEYDKYKGYNDILKYLSQDILAPKHKDYIDKVNKR